MKKSYVVSTLGLVAMLITLLSVSSTVTTYSSKAYQKQSNVFLQSASVSPEHVKQEDLPRCVGDIRYIPNTLNTFSSCYVQIMCKNEIDVQKVPMECSQSNTLLSCDVSDCRSLDEWMQTAQIACGC